MAESGSWEEEFLLFASVICHRLPRYRDDSGYLMNYIHIQHNDIFRYMEQFPDGDSLTI